MSRPASRQVHVIQSVSSKMVATLQKLRARFCASMLLFGIRVGKRFLPANFVLEQLFRELDRVQHGRPLLWVCVQHVSDEIAELGREGRATVADPAALFWEQQGSTLGALV